MRLPMTPSELVSLGRALEELERPKARERMEWASDPSAPRNLGVGKQTRDVVGEALGMSGPTYQRIKAVVNAAEDESLPENVREVARQAQAQMDETGVVHPA